MHVISIIHLISDFDIFIDIRPKLKMCKICLAKEVFSLIDFQILPTQLLPMSFSARY